MKNENGASKPALCKLVKQKKLLGKTQSRGKGVNNAEWDKCGRVMTTKEPDKKT